MTFYAAPSRGRDEPALSAFHSCGRRLNSFPAVAQTNPRGDLFYWIGPAGEAREEGEGTDFHAVKAGRVSITPLQVDMTDHQRLPAWQGWVAQR